MKVKAEHYALLKSAIDKTLSKHNQNGALVVAYENGIFPRPHRVKNLQWRFCWDLFYASRLPSRARAAQLKRYNDNDIYTALKSICPKVTKSDTYERANGQWHNVQNVDSTTLVHT